MVTAGACVGAGQATVRMGLGDGTFSSTITQYGTESGPSNALALSDLNGDGILDMVTAGLTDGDVGQATVRMGLGDGTFSSTNTQYSTESSGSYALALSDLNGDGVQDIVTAGIGGGAGQATVRLATTQDGIAPILPFDLSTMAGARQAISLFKQKLSHITTQRGEIGAFQARAESATNTLRLSTENFIAAASRITDADIAEESGKLVRAEILQQAGAAVLAQANQQPELVLQLLEQV